MLSRFDDPEHWLSQEREARGIADAAENTKVREFFLRLAADYRKRAEKSERRRKGAHSGNLVIQLASS
jgi:hypothetical protein